MALKPLEIFSLAPVRTDQVEREKLLAYFENTWNLYEMLFSSIQEEATLYLQPDPLRHPLIFYLGHTAAFYINKLVIAGLLKETERINPHFERIFEQGVDPAQSGELGQEAWPEARDVRRYRQQVFELLSRFIREMDLNLPIDSGHPLWSLLMGFEHDRIHFETSSVLIRQLPADLLTRPQDWHYAPRGFQTVLNQWIEVPATEVKLGKPKDFPTFGWDNEYGDLAVDVAAFKASQNLITNNEFIEFVEAGGYHTRKYWSEEGWAWKEQEQVSHPKFWVPTTGTYFYRALFDEFEMPGSWPVEVNHHEAMAYCGWKGYGTRLLSEAEFQAIAKTSLSQDSDLNQTGDYNLNLTFGSPCPVGMKTQAGSSLGFTDVRGNVWCWLSNDFYPLPDFEAHPYYKDFSEVYMDAGHSMLLGGAWATSGTGASPFYRLWFRRHFYQHAGFRTAKDSPHQVH